jgi:hypothetical protein
MESLPPTKQLTIEQAQVAMEAYIRSAEAATHFERRCLVHRTGRPRHLYKYRPSLSRPDSPAEESRLRNQFENLILNNELWMSSPQDFNDPFDGCAVFKTFERGVAYRDTLGKYLKKLGRDKGFNPKKMRKPLSYWVANPEKFDAAFNENHESARSKVGICSLSANPHSPLMWAHYANDHRGVCVQFRLSGDVRNMIAYPVVYDDKFPVICDPLKINAGALQHAAFLQKSSDWAYEKEWRLLSIPGAREVRRINHDAISGLILGLRVTECDHDFVMTLLAKRESKYGYAIPVYKARRSVDRYRLKFDRLA